MRKRRWWLVVTVVLVGGALALVRSGWFGAPTAAEPLAVPDGDQEVAWLHTSTSGETWENFVWGVKRAEMTTAGLRVDDSAAFPAHTTAIPEVTIARDGFAGKLRVRWYKVTNYASTAAWVKGLAARDPVPVAVVGGWSSDRARELAETMAAANWTGPKPLLLLATATADSVPGNEPDYRPRNLIALYDRSFRFCFTNRQMAEAVTDFVFTDPALRPGSVVLPGLRVVPGAAGGMWAALPWLAEARAEWMSYEQHHGKGLQAFAVAWEDDPYSLDLYQQFRDVIEEQGKRPDRPWLVLEKNLVAFSAGRFARANPYEAQVVDHILGRLPRRGERTLLVVPTVTGPARRVLGALAEGNPAVARRLVAVTGDGISVNTLFRDGEFAWPVRAIPIPLVLFTHTDPFGWDERGANPAPPRGYELTPPARLGDVKSSTEDILLFSTLVRVLARGAFPDGGDTLVDGPDTLAARFHTLSPPFFDKVGNRLRGSGEYVVVLRPTPRTGLGAPMPDATINVYTRRDGEWVCVHSRQVIQTVRLQHAGVGE